MVAGTDGDLLAEGSLTRIRACVQLVRANEPAIRSRVARLMFGPWQRLRDNPGAGEVSTEQGFRDTLVLVGYTFYSTQGARLVYHAGNQFGGLGVSLTVGPRGEFLEGPEPD